MPLKAKLDGVWINAALLSEAEWLALRVSRSILMPCCGKRAYQRRSRLDTRHFVHSPGSHCGSPGESAEHLAAKAEIVRVCRDLGWDVQSEFAGENWRADIYATKTRHRIAFEVQWSPQSFEVTRERHSAYGDEVKCCWLFRKLPSPARRPAKRDPNLAAAEARLPMFELSLSDSGFLVTLDRTRLPLSEFVRARLERRIRFCANRHYTSREIQLVTSVVCCWHCGTEYDVFLTRRFLRSECGVECAEADWDTYDDDDPCGARYNWSLLKEHFSSQTQHLRTSVKRRWSNKMKEFYWSFGCPSCDAIFGARFFRDVEADAEDSNIALLCSQQVGCSELDPDAHWCFPQNGKFCGTSLPARK